jgi:amino acid adenylation domain-containing protein
MSPGSGREIDAYESGLHVSVTPEVRSWLLTVARGDEPAGEAPDLVAQFRAQAVRRPEHRAVQASDGVLSYRELDRQSESFALRLRALGARTESRVGIAVPRGARELVALLGTLKAGAAYVPIDPSHPVERVRVILQDAIPELLVAPSDSPLVTVVPPGVTFVPFDALSSAGGVAGRDQVVPGVVPSGEPVRDSLAYVLFTSGSTGRPKGVEITRGALANFLRSMARVPGLDESDRLLAVTTTTFDIAGLELFLPLWLGATIVIADRETVRDPLLLRRMLEDERPTVMQATPATWHLLLESGWTGDGRLRLLCGGEAMTSQLAERLVACGGALWNVYGPTETTIWSTIERIEAGAPRVTIGRPIDHTQVYVLDEDRELVPPGVVGELFIGGRGLARGYLGRADLTAERFVPDPYGAAGARLYRTGDLGRVLQDGRLECLGRLDRQVKIRGSRVELGEVESVLRSVPGVTETVVVALRERADYEDPSLHVYWTGTAEREALYEAARARLPSAMVPSIYVKLAAFPLNTNGKIDHQALRETAVRGPEPLGRGPRTRAEERMAAIWSEVLGVAAVVVDQDFFMLGGTSAKAVEVRARIEEVFGVQLPLRVLFESPTIEHLVAHLGDGRSEGPIVVPLRRGRPEVPPLHCLMGIELFQDLARALEGERSVYGIHVPTWYVPGVDRRPTVEEIANSYLPSIKRLQPHGPYHVAGFCFGGIVAFELARLLEAAGEEVRVVAVLDADLPSAKGIRWAPRLASVVARAVRDPRRVARVASERLGGALRASLVGPARAAAGTPGSRQAIDTGTEGDDDIVIAAAYERAIGTLRAARLLVFRAVERGEPSWMNVAADLGWKGRASLVSTYDIPSDHVSMVRPPHVAAIAAALDRAMLDATETRASSER